MGSKPYYEQLWDSQTVTAELWTVLNACYIGFGSKWLDFAHSILGASVLVFFFYPLSIAGGFWAVILYCPAQERHWVLI